MPPPEIPMRIRIQQVALELFLDRGYDGTSLREISERLGVTKAALYYHFRSKDAILLSLIADLERAIDELVRWGAAQPFGAQLQDEVIERLATLFYSEASRVVRLMQENQPVLRTLVLEDTAHGAARMAGPGEWVDALTRLLTPAGAGTRHRARVRAAVMAIIFGSFVDTRPSSDPAIPMEEKRAATMTVARELVTGSFAPAAHPVGRGSPLA